MTVTSERKWVMSVMSTHKHSEKRHLFEVFKFVKANPEMVCK